MPWRDIEGLAPEPSGLYERSWREADAAGRVEVLRHDGPFVDCGTPRDYLAANLAACDGKSAVEDGALVAGQVVRSVVWGRAVVRPGEVLVDAIRYEGVRTVLVRG